MYERQVEELEELLAAIRARTGALLSRAEVIRALLDALFESGIDVTGVRSGSHLKELIGAMFATGSQNR